MIFQNVLLGIFGAVTLGIIIFMILVIRQVRLSKGISQFCVPIAWVALLFTFAIMCLAWGLLVLFLMQ